MGFDQIIQTIAIAALPILFAITMHEAAHGVAAYHFGDRAAQRSLNPVHYIDPIGTVLLPIITLALGGIIFGWARTSINYAALRHPKKDMAWVALAGPAANLGMLLFWGVVAKVALSMQGNYFAEPMLEMAEFGIRINAVLVALNLLPLPPLDGGHVAIGLLPQRQAYQLARLEPYGIFILLFLAITPLLGMLLTPVVLGLEAMVRVVLGL